MNLSTIAAVSSISALAVGAGAYVYGQRKMLDAEKQLIEGMLNGYQLPTGWDNVREVDLTVDMGDVQHRVKQRLQDAKGVVERVRSSAADWVQDQVHRLHEQDAALGDALVHDLGTFRVECKGTPVDDEGRLMSRDDFDTGEQTVAEQFKEAVLKLANFVDADYMEPLNLLLQAADAVILHGELITSQLMLDHVPTDNSALAYALHTQVDGVNFYHEVGLVIDGVVFAVSLADFAPAAIANKYQPSYTQESSVWAQLEAVLKEDTKMSQVEVIEEVHNVAQVKALQESGVLGNVLVVSSQARPRLYTLTVSGITGYEETLSWNEHQGLVVRCFLELDPNEGNLW